MKTKWKVITLVNISVFNFQHDYLLYSIDYFSFFGIQNFLNYLRGGGGVKPYLKIFPNFLFSFWKTSPKNISDELEENQEHAKRMKLRKAKEPWYNMKIRMPILLLYNLCEHVNNVLLQWQTFSFLGFARLAFRKSKQFGICFIYSCYM